MTVTITHNKTNTLTDWTQGDLDTVIGGGAAPLPPPGTLISNVVLPSDWNDDHVINGLATVGETGEFVDLVDVPSTYTGQASKFVKVKATEDGLEFVAGSGVSTEWGDITGALSNQTDLQTALDGKVDENAAITGATKTKVTYDAKGLVTAGADATTADIADSTDKRYVTDAQLTVIGNTSGTNTGDVTVSDSAEIDFTLTGQQISASIVSGSIDETKLDTSVNASLDLADSAVQPAALASYVPYTGATANVDLGTYDLITDTVTAKSSAGLIIEANGGGDVLHIGNGGGVNATAYGGWNFDGATANTIASFGASKTLSSLATATYPDLTEISYVKGVTSAIQTQLNGKLTGNQTITLSGDVTGSGTTGITTTISAGAVDIAMLSATGTPSGTTYLRGDNTWATVSGSGDVSKVGTPANNQIGVWTGDGTIEGTNNLTYDGSILYAASYIGVGRATPDCALDVDVNINAARAIQLYNSDTAISDGERVASIYFKQNDTSNPNTVHASIDAVGIGSTGSLALSFQTGGGGVIAERLYLSGTAADFTVPARPKTNDAAALGAATLSWSDLFLASGGVINFNNGNATLTHSAGLITSNVDIAVPDEAYGSGWNASLEVPTKNAVYDKLESMQMVYTLAGDQATASVHTNPVTLTGLVFTYEANSIYTIDLYGAVSSAANTTGCGFQFDLSSAVTTVWLTFVHQLANTGTQSGGHSVADDASVGVSSGVSGSGTVVPVMGRGLLITTGNTGTAQLRYRAEIDAQTTCKAGTTMVVRKVA